ncbi:hypothetical protein CWI39_1904p0010 [Hamiltosporidium magnivora]|uniref:Uncharacterized protein n=1 Tax=Hamiltosporidium magnivora TaxID=148818 RepID=A0A4Q9KXS5_9MICR|nr:hypothetical protein CWI39_1904p0010 [Hamiltosporidium magnivora]
MRTVCYFVKKNTFLFHIFIVVCLFERILSRNYNIDEYRDIFVKKSLDLYYKKTKGLASWLRAVDYTFLFCYDSQIRAFANVLSNHIQAKSSNNYEININIPNSKSTRNIERIKLNNLNNHFVSIEDSCKGIFKKTPKKYLSYSIDILLNSKNGVWIKVFSEFENFEENIDEDKMIEIFKTTHREMLCFSHLNYTLYIIDKSDLELDESTYRKKVLKKSIKNRYKISFHSTLPNITNETTVFLLRQTFKFETYFFVTEFEYLHSTRKSDDSEYKFKILLKFSSFTFGFDFNWYVTKHPFNRFRPDSLYYIYVIAGKFLIYLKFRLIQNEIYFRIEKSITIVPSSNCDYIRNLQNPDQDFTLQQLFYYLVFKR